MKNLIFLLVHNVHNSILPKQLWAIRILGACWVVNEHQTFGTDQIHLSGADPQVAQHLPNMGSMVIGIRSDLHTPEEKTFDLSTEDFEKSFQSHEMDDQERETCKIHETSTLVSAA